MLQIIDVNILLHSQDSLSTLTENLMAQDYRPITWKAFEKLLDKMIKDKIHNDEGYILCNFGQSVVAK